MFSLLAVGTICWISSGITGEFETPRRLCDLTFMFSGDVSLGTVTYTEVATTSATTVVAGNTGGTTTPEQEETTGTTELTTTPDLTTTEQVTTPSNREASTPTQSDVTGGTTQTQPGATTDNTEEVITATTAAENDGTTNNTGLVPDAGHQEDNADNGRLQGSLLAMVSANEKRRYKVSSSFIGWDHTQIDPWRWMRKQLINSKHSCLDYKVILFFYKSLRFILILISKFSHGLLKYRRQSFWFLMRTKNQDTSTSCMVFLDFVELLSDFVYLYRYVIPPVQ